MDELNKRWEGDIANSIGRIKDQYESSPQPATEERLGMIKSYRDLLYGDARDVIMRLKAIGSKKNLKLSQDNPET
jgi:hypothetical protein